jgi:hypothetical protein
MTEKPAHETLSCWTCRFMWKGTCRKNAPVAIGRLAVVGPISGAPLWPVVGPDDFCFQWERHQD